MGAGRTKVVRIVAGDEQGTGFLIAGDRLLTAWHVVADSGRTVGR